MASSLLSELPFNLMLADLSMLQKDQFSLLKSIQEMAPRMVVIVNAYAYQREGAKKAMTLGAKGYFLKPIMVGALRVLVDGFSENAARN